MTRINSLILQTIFEALIPLLGYFFWHWDTSFILLFYYLDWCAFIVLTAFKAKKRVSFTSDKTEQSLAQKHMLIGILLMIFTGVLVWNLLPRLSADFNWSERIWSFLSYTEMGIAQGLVILPLLVLNGILLYKQQFIQLRLYEKLIMRQITEPLLKQSVLLLGASGLFLGVSFFTIYPPETVLFATIFGTMVYRFLARR